MSTTFPILQPLLGWMRAATDHSGGSSASTKTPGTVPRIGLALSAGGARGLAHVGVLQVFEEEGIPIAAIAGTSMGAYVGSLFAAGVNGRRLEELAKEIKDRKTLLSLLDPVFPPSVGLIRGEKVRRHLERSLGTLTFEELPIPLLVVATDLDTLDAHVFNSGSVAAAVHASSAIPCVCAPVQLNGRRFTDGGPAEPLPVTLLKERFNLDAVIAVNVLPTVEDLERGCDASFVCPKESPNLVKRWLGRCFRPLNLMAYGNVMDTFRRSLMCAQLRLAAKESRRAEVVVHPSFAASSWYDFERADRYIQPGRVAAQAALPAIRELLKGAGHRERPYENLVRHPEMELSAA